MRNVFSRDTLLPATYLLYLRYIERAGSIKQARCNFEKKNQPTFDQRGKLCKN